MAVIINDMDMPKNCYDCDLHNYHECDLTTESIEEDYCWNGDRREKHCPLKSADEMIAEISVCKTENEMRIAERDYKSRLWISGIFSEIVEIIHKYCDKEPNNV